MSTSSFILADSLTAAAIIGPVVKVTLLLMAAGAVGLVLRRRSAAARHFVWALALASSVALTLLSPFAPAVPVPISNAAAFRAIEWPNALALPATVNDRTAVPPSALVRDAAGDASVAGSGPSPTLGTVLLVVWLVGFAAMLCWLMVGRIGLARLTRNAEAVLAPDWLALLADTRASIGIAREVRLRRSGVVGAPITWGLARPVVLLPLDADQWSQERRRVVLQHELAHVARHDYVMQMIATLACALYWFHPGVWMAARRLRSESERACDDQVLALGTTAVDYAAHLLSVASGARALRLTGAVAIGMARRSALEGRLLAALDQSVPRAPLSARARVVSVAALGAAVLPLAGMRAVERAAPLPAVLAAPLAPVVDSTFERIVAASPGERLYLDLEPGGDVDIRGWDEARVQVRVTLRGANWRDVSVEVGRDGDGVVIRSRYEARRSSQSSSNRYEIRVPRRYDVRLSSGGGDLTIVDVEGSFRGTTGGGEMVLERLRGRASLSTGGGDISVRDVDLSGSVSTGGGMVVLSRVRGGLRGSSGSGPVVYAESPNAQTTNEPTAEIQRLEVDKVRDRISMTASGAGTVHITKAGGDVTLDEAPGGAVIQTGGGRVRVGAAAGFVDAKTGGGDITIGPVAGSVRAGTGAGTIEVTLIEAGGEKQTVEISAGVGRVILELPASFDGRFDVETAYSRRFGRATRITSDWDLERETTTEWDDREGTPRRYVRARGTVGRGRGLVHIKTMNGDIEVRRGR